MTNSSPLLWTQPGWLETAKNWIKVELNRLGINLVGPFEQPHIRPWSTVIRVPTSAGNLYFKAVAPELAHEAALTRYLSRWRTDCMPQVLSADSEQGWLLMADGGMRLRKILQAESDLRHWTTLLPIYAELQLDLSGRLDELLGMGVPDRRLAILPAQFEDLLTHTGVLGLDRPEGLSSAEYRQLKDSTGLLARWCEQLAAFDIPESLDHGDFHDGNIFVHQGRYTFFDWGDSSITHPFFTLRTAFVSLENSLGLDEDSPWFEQLRIRYLERWLGYETKERLAAAFKLSQRLSPLTAALRWLSALSRVDEPGRSDYAAAIPSLLREFLSVKEEP